MDQLTELYCEGLTLETEMSIAIRQGNKQEIKKATSAFQAGKDRTLAFLNNKFPNLRKV